jgi:hypothetical protein
MAWGCGALVLLPFLVAIFGRLGTHLLVVLLQGGQVLARLRVGSGGG